MRRGQGPSTLPEEVRAQLGASPRDGFRAGWQPTSIFEAGPDSPGIFFFFFFFFSFPLSSSLLSELEEKLQLGRERFLPCPPLGSHGSRGGSPAPALLPRWAFLATCSGASCRGPVRSSGYCKSSVHVRSDIL